MNKLTKPQTYVLLLVAIALLAMGAFLLGRSEQNDPTANGGLHPQNGTYTITRVNSMQCTFRQPPDCTGELILTPGAPEELEATVDRHTKVRHQSKDMQIYPDALKAGMAVQITFKPNSGVIDTAVIAE